MALPVIPSVPQKQVAHFNLEAGQVQLIRDIAIGSGVSIAQAGRVVIQAGLDALTK